MLRIVYFVTATGKDSYYEFLRKMFSQHKAVFMFSAGLSPKTKNFYEKEGIVDFPFDKKGYMEIDKETFDDILELKRVRSGFSQNEMELVVSIKNEQRLRNLDPTSLVFCEVFSSAGNTDRGKVWTVAHYQSFGFKVFNESFCEIFPESGCPNERLKISGKGVVENEQSDSGRAPFIYSPPFFTPRETAMIRANPRLPSLGSNLGDPGSYFKNGKKRQASIY